MDLNKIDGNFHTNYNQPPKEENLIKNILSLEIFEKILSYLDQGDLQRASLVSRDWSLAAIDTAKRKEFSKIKNFVNFLAENLDENLYPTEKKQLFDICSNKKILNAKNLIQIKFSINFYKEELLKILNDLDVNTLQKLEKLSQNESRPRFFEDVFSLTKIYKNYDPKAVKHHLNEISKINKSAEAIEKLLGNFTKENFEEFKKLDPISPIFLTGIVVNEKEHEEMNEKNKKYYSLSVKILLNFSIFFNENVPLFAKKLILEDSKSLDPQLKAFFIKANVNEIAKWYLMDLKVSKNEKKSQDEFALEQLEKFQKLLISDRENNHEVLLERIENRIEYIKDKSSTEKKEKIQKEQPDEIRNYFCELFEISLVG